MASEPSCKPPCCAFDYSPLDYIMRRTGCSSNMTFCMLMIAIVGLTTTVAWTTTTTPLHRNCFTPRRFMRNSNHLFQAAARSSSSSPSPSSSRRTNQQTQQDMLRFMDQPVVKTVLKEDMVLDESTLDLVHCIVKAADGRKAENIVALQVQHLSTLTSVLVVLSGNSRPQNQAIAAAVARDVAERNVRNGDNENSVATEGTAESGWMLLDYGSVMVHIMTPKSRLFYNIEGMWKDGAIPLDLSNMLIPNTMVPVADVVEDDPFWS